MGLVCATDASTGPVFSSANVACVSSGRCDCDCMGCITDPGPILAAVQVRSTCGGVDICTPPGAVRGNAVIVISVSSEKRSAAFSCFVVGNGVCMVAVLLFYCNISWSSQWCSRSSNEEVIACFIHSSLFY